MISGNSFRKLLSVVSVLLLVSVLFGCGNRQPSQAPAQPAASSASAEVNAQPFSKVRHAEITVKDYGTIKLELDEGTAPITVETS